MPAHSVPYMIQIERKVTIAAIGAVSVAIFAFGYNAATANGRISQLERDTAPIGQINERTIRIEEQVNAIRQSLKDRH